MLIVTVHSAPSKRTLLPNAEALRVHEDSVYWFAGDTVPTIAADTVVPSVHTVAAPQPPWQFVAGPGGHHWLSDGLRWVGAWEAVVNGLGGAYGFTLVEAKAEKGEASRA